MKVLMFGWEFPPHISGGLGTACYGIVSGLLHQGIQVTFVIPRLYGGEDTGSFRLLNASDIFVDMEDPVVQKWHDKLNLIEVNSPLSAYATPDEPGEQLLELKQEQSIVAPARRQQFVMSGKYGQALMHEVFKYAIVASQLARDQVFDIIHVHDWLAFPAGIAAKEASGKPLIVHVHATEYDRSGEQVNKTVFDIEQNGMQQADHVIAVSEYTRQIIISKYGIHQEKVSVAHNGIIPKDGFRGTKRAIEEKVVTFMGRITYQKGPQYFIEAAAKVLKKNPGVRFVMAGSGDMMAQMIQRVAELGISSRFHFTGFLSGSDVDYMYSMSDVYVMPSVSEPFGIAPLEAIQANVPVIISRQSGVSEVIKHAIKVDFWNIDELADAISALLQYKTLSEMFKQEGKKDLSDLKWENTGLKIKNVYESALTIT